MFDEETNKKLLKWYSMPGVDYVQFREGKGMKPEKCWVCHHRPCICHLTDGL